jgi:hypothetical protein
VKSLRKAGLFDIVNIHPLRKEIAMDALKAPSLPAPAPAPAQMRPADYARAINDKLSQMVASARTTLQRAIEIGELLKQAKERVGHGNFEAWVTDHCQLSYRSARRYMTLARDRTEIEAQAKMANVANLNATTAQRLLAPPKKQEGSGQGKRSSGKPKTEKYKIIENDLIVCLKDLREKAESYASGTIEALKEAVDDIKGVIEQARRMP